MKGYKLCMLLLVAALAADAAGAQSAKADQLLLAEIQTSADSARLRAVVSQWDRRGEALGKLYSGLAMHMLALQDAAQWADRAVAALREVRGTDQDALALAYQGSAVTLQASVDNQKGNVVGASAKLNAGFELMDQAVRNAPDNSSIRFLRLENALAISETTPFKRMESIEADLQALTRYEAVLPADTKAQLLLARARYSLLKRDAAAALKLLYECRRLAPASPAAAEAARFLARLEE